ncbi:MAG: hypothetical protein J6N56_01330 [Bacteroidales bacterium]|nr:hypothetical protein [Bacteroidales bacterium]
MGSFIYNLNDTNRMNRLYSILIVAAMAFCMSGCSKDDGKEDNGKTDLPQYSIKIKKDGKTIFQGELHSGSLTYTPLKEAFMVVDMIVVPKYPDKPESTMVETGVSFDNGSFMTLRQFFSYDVVSKEGTFNVEQMNSPSGVVLGKLYYYGSTDGEKWTLLGGNHVITKVKVLIEKHTLPDGVESELRRAFIDGKFTIKYKDKTGEHIITGEYRNLFDLVTRSDFMH